MQKHWDNLLFGLFFGVGWALVEFAIWLVRKAVEVAHQ